MFQSKFVCRNELKLFEFITQIFNRIFYLPLKKQQREFPHVRRSRNLFDKLPKILSVCIPRILYILVEVENSEKQSRLAPLSYSGPRPLAVFLSRLYLRAPLVARNQVQFV